MSVQTWEDALRQWVLISSGLAASNVYFSDQDVKRAPGPYVTLRPGSLMPRGVDALERDFDANRVGQEIQTTIVGEREFMLLVAVWNAPTTSRDGLSAMALAEQIRTSLRLPSIRRRINRGGVGVLNTSTIRNLSVELGSAFEGRANFEVRSIVHSTVFEFVTWIERVSGIISIENQDTPFDLVKS